MPVLTAGLALWVCFFARASPFAVGLQKPYNLVEMISSVSVVMPVFNRVHTLARALDSVQKQIHAVHEIIVVDDGSTDGVGPFIQQQYPAVRLITQARQGVSAARNRGIRAAEGRWIALLDSDDAWAPQKIARQLAALAAEPLAPLCHTNEIWIRRGRRVNPMKKHEKRGGWIFQDCLPRCVISPSSVLIDKQIFETVGYFDADLPVCEDYDLWLRICAAHPTAFVDAPLTVKTGGHADQLSRQYWGMDRFRVRALDKILRAGVLSKQNEVASQAMLHEKCRVLLKGAIKHRNCEVQDACEVLMRRHPLNLDKDHNGC